MIKRKPTREHGKIPFSKYFQKFSEGDRVSVKRELTVQPKFPKQLQGRSGVISGKRGNSYIVSVFDVRKEKTYIIHPVHLRRLQ